VVVWSGKWELCGCVCKVGLWVYGVGRWGGWGVDVEYVVIVVVVVLMSVCLVLGDDVVLWV
jgi:hypothetical protein